MQVLKESEALALSEPFPYALVTSLDKNGRPNAMGVAWATRTSIEPFLILISIDHRRYSHEGIRTIRSSFSTTRVKTRPKLPGFAVQDRGVRGIR